MDDRRFPIGSFLSGLLAGALFGGEILALILILVVLFGPFLVGMFIAAILVSLVTDVPAAGMGFMTAGGLLCTAVCWTVLIRDEIAAARARRAAREQADRDAGIAGPDH